MILVLHQIYINLHGNVMEDMPAVAVNWDNVRYMEVDAAGTWLYFDSTTQEGIHVRETMKQILIALASMGAKVRDINA